MSSMFKKKGGPAFKPKIPSARSRPVARPTQPIQHVEPEPPIDTPDDTDTRIDASQTDAASKKAGQPSVPELSPSETSKSDSAPAQADTTASPPLSTNDTSDGQRKEEPTATTRSEPPTVNQATPDDDSNEAAIEDDPGAETVTATASGAVETPDSDQTPAPKIATRSRKASAAAAQGTDDVDPGAEPSRPKKRQRKTTQDGSTTAKPRQRKQKAASEGENGQTRTRRARSLTPEDAETQTVDLQKLKMADLTKDLHIGKKFSRHDELRDRERQKRMKAKIEKDGGTPDIEGEVPDATRTKEQSSTPSAPAAAPSQAPAGPQFRIVDGQIVVDQNSLAVDRHARAAAARAGEDMETIEENDFTRLITSNSFMNTSKLRGPNNWTDEETVLFYRGLAMFGTDFEIISKMIPGKQRRHVKLKFNREERHCPRRINAALVGEKTVAMDMEEYKAATGAEYETVEAITAEQQKIEDSYETERQRIVDEQAEVMRKKKEELFADEDMDMAGIAPGGKKKKARKNKKKVEYGHDGEPIATE